MSFEGSPGYMERHTGILSASDFRWNREKAGQPLKPCCLAQVVRYEAGYVVCAVIAGFYLLSVPITGLCFCCCRCHRRCGGRVKTEHKAMACERGTLMTFLLLTTLVLL